MIILKIKLNVISEFPFTGSALRIFNKIFSPNGTFADVVSPAIPNVAT